MRTKAFRRTGEDASWSVETIFLGKDIEEMKVKNAWTFAKINPYGFIHKLV
jgi:hypothetical protein